ncbi:MAG: LysE family translocator [Rhodobacteraceae bacterium]|nr:LysE family translocator [Paracoccaceae bacterium]
MSLAAFVGIALLHLMAAISPGPSFIVAVRTSVAEGFASGAGIAIGLGLGAVIWATAALAGLALLFEYAPAFLTVFKIAGGAVLIWIAWQTWSHAGDPIAEPQIGALPRSARSAVRLGLLTQLANPKPAVFFGAVFVGLIPEATPVGVLAALLATLFTTETLWYILVARAVSLDGPRRAYGRVKSGIDRLFGGLIALLGAKFALT